MRLEFRGILCLATSVAWSLLWLVPCRAQEPTNEAPAKAHNTIEKDNQANAAEPLGTTVTVVLAKDFQALTPSGGTGLQGERVVMRGLNCSFEIATSMTGGVEYRVGVEAQNSPIGDVIIALRTTDDNRWIGQVKFTAKDGSFSWQDITVKPELFDLTSVQICMVCDYFGPKGDLNAEVTRVRVMRVGGPPK
ncbi:hypothetical protein FJY63_07860 [Candidatus Sumerlaeota bacterium]|nr:hypothetical protein [Candidatus Sumerlaeota bacterium]